MATNENLKGVSVTSFSIRTSGPQPVACGQYGFLLQTFGAEKSVTHNYCSIVDKLKGTKNMQAFMPAKSSYPDPDDPNNPGSVEQAGPYKSVSYQAKRTIVDLGSGAQGLLFSGTEQFSAVYCDDEDAAIAGESSSCDSTKVI